MITFLRSSEYKVIAEGKSLYKSFDLMAQEVFDPDLITKLSDKSTKNNVKVLCSPSLRTQQSGRKLRSDIIVDNLLREIKFSMDEILSENAFRKLPVHERVDVTRKLFFQKFVDDQVFEPFNSVRLRILELVQKLLDYDQETVCISHSFFMKVFEVACDHPEILDMPTKLLKYYDGSYKAYGYDEGFVVVRQQLERLIKAI